MTPEPKLHRPKRKYGIGVSRYWLPTLFGWDGKPVDAVSAYFLCLAHEKREKVETIRNYASVLLAFWKYLHWVHLNTAASDEPFDWRQITAEQLRTWRDMLLFGRGFSQGKRGRGSNTVLYYRNRVFDFLEWASKNGWMLVEVWDSRKAGEAPLGMLSRTEVAVEEQRFPHLHVPTDDEMDGVMAAIAANSPEKIRARDLLILRWAKEAGLRNTEIRSLTKAHLPSATQIRKWKVQGITPTMEIKGKGGKVRTTEPPFSLLDDTWNYLNEIQEGFSNAEQRLWQAEGEHLFFGPKYKQLARTYVSQRMAHYFRLAGYDNHLHRARAYYIFNLIRAKVRELAVHGKLVELHVATIIRFVLDRVGHESMDTLKHYVDMSVMTLGFKKVKHIEAE